MKKYIYLKPTFKNGQLFALDQDGKDYTRVVREHMLNLAKANDQSIQYDPEAGKCYRKPLEMFDEQTPAKPEVATVDTISEDPVLAFIHSSYDLKPEVLKMPELKWKYLIRSAVRGKNIMMTGMDLKEPKLYMMIICNQKLIYKGQYGFLDVKLV